MRKLILTAVMAIAMTALLATSASAAVEVRNGNGELCGWEGPVCEVTFDGEVEITPANMNEHYMLEYHCNAEWTIEVYADGALYLQNPEFEPYSFNEYCQAPVGPEELDFCGSAVQPGQITQSGDAEYVGPGHTEPAPGFHIKHYNAVFDTCWHSGYDNWSSGTFGKMRFDIEDHDYPTEYDEYEPPLAFAFESQLAFPDAPGSPAAGATIELVGDHQLPAGALIITSVEE
jgi:hypothetical protein